MRSQEITKLVAGFKRFREKYFVGEDPLYPKLVTIGQSPKTLVIGCCDSRVDPALVASASPGEIFVVRNVANLVPPHESAAHGFHGVSAAIEFAVNNLKVENVVILGHRQCGGIRALMSSDSANSHSFVDRWMSMARDARDTVLRKFPDMDFESQCRECEMEAIKTSHKNLLSFPFIRKAADERGMRVFGIYFDLEQGQLFEFEEALDSFTPVDLNKV